MRRMLLNREFFLLGVEEDFVSSLLSVYRILTRMITMKAMNVLTNIGEVIPYIFFIRDTMKFVAIADTASAIAFFQSGVSDGGSRFGGRPRQHLGLPVQDGPLGRLYISADLSAVGGVRGPRYHGERAGARPQDRPRRRGRVSGGVEEIRLGWLARRAVAVPDHELLCGARRLLQIGRASCRERV